MDIVGKQLEGIYGNRILLDGELVPALIKINDGKISKVIRRTKDSPIIEISENVRTKYTHYIFKKFKT